MTGFLQTFAGLVVVIALILGCAWVLRGSQRFGLRGNPLLRVVAAQALTTRERVVVVELGDTWLVLGVAPGQVSRLARLARPADLPVAAGGAAPGATANGFPAWLERALQRK
jgi:flagellar protein FliO/FliZ